MYKVGDIVWVKSWEQSIVQGVLEEQDGVYIAGTCKVAGDMKLFMGWYGKIVESHESMQRYKIEGCDWYWSAEMLETLHDEVAYSPSRMIDAMRVKQDKVREVVSDFKKLYEDFLESKNDELDKLELIIERFKKIEVEESNN